MRTSVRITSAKRYKTFVSSDKAWLVRVRVRVQRMVVVVTRGGEERGLPCSVSNITYKYVCQAAPARAENNGDNDTSAQNRDGQDTPNNGKCGATYFGETSKNMYTRDSVGTGSHRELYNKRSHKSFMKNHQDLKHEGEPEKFKCVVLEKFQDPLTRQVAESLNIANGMNATELCNSRAEYHQPQIVRVSREVQRGL